MAASTWPAGLSGTWTPAGAGTDADMTFPRSWATTKQPSPAGKLTLMPPQVSSGALRSLWFPPARWLPASHATPRATIADPTWLVTAVAISADGTWPATASTDGTARTWNADGNPRTTIAGHTDQVTAVAISADGAWLATTSHDRTVRVWNPSTGKIVAMLRVEDALLTCAWASDGALAAGGPRGLYMFGFDAGHAASLS
jgi:WD40 repeat protein